MRYTLAIYPFGESFAFRGFARFLFLLFKGFGGIRFDPGTAPSAMEAHEVVVDKSMTSSELLCSAPKSERDE